jgi:hypothetical protein
LVGRLLGAISLAALVYLASSSFQPARAQSPTQAALRCSVSDTNPRTGTQIEVLCSLDNFGVPVTNTDLTFYINFENKTDASLGNGRKAEIKQTDAQGRVKALLDTGPRAGNFGLLVNFPGIYSSFTFIRVDAPPLPPVLLELAPPPLPPATDLTDGTYTGSSDGP